jgi:hypothetical protein
MEAAIESNDVVSTAQIRRERIWTAEWQAA